MRPEDVILAVLREARLHVGAHYLHGAGGSAPGGHDGCFGRRGGVVLHRDDPDFSHTPPRRHPQANRSKPILKAATIELGGHIFVCAGRSSLDEVLSLPQCASNEAGVWTRTDIGTRCTPPSAYRWPRPYGMIESRELVWGEPCAGIRHFDCIMYIRYIVEHGASHIPQNFIPSTISGWRSHPRGRRVPITDVRAGDILIERAGGHIAIAESPRKQLNAEDTIWGVRANDIPGNAVVIRLDDSFWLGLPAHR